jgi:HK97 gp10 family phage protein
MRAGGGIKIEGLSELNRKLGMIPDAIRIKALKSLMEHAAQPIVEAAKANAPVLTGELRASIGTTRPKEKDGTISIQVQPGEGFFFGDEYYAGFIEFGHHLGKRGTLGRKFIEPKPFLRPAVDSQGENAIGVMVDGVGNIVAGVMG